MRRLGLGLLLALVAAGAWAADTPDTEAPAGAGPPPPPPDWLPRGTAEIQALDKVNARRETLDISVGGTANFGALKITARSCVVRPPSQPKDAAAFLVIQDPHPGAPNFTGWMLASAPEVSMLEHPIYDVRVLGCR